MAFRIGHETPAVSEFVKVFCILPLRSQGLDLSAGNIHVLDPDIEVKAILDGLRFGNPLKAHPWETGRRWGKIHERRRIA
jgi:hypothetical protein